MIDHSEDFFQGWFVATPLEIYKCLHDFSTRFIEEEDYYIDPVLNGNVISVTGIVLESISGYDPAYIRPARSYGKLEFLSPIEDNPKPTEFRVLADPGSDEFWNPFLIFLRVRFRKLDPRLIKRKKKTGRPDLSDDELIFRISKVLEAEDLIKEDPEMKWNEAMSKVGWDRGETPKSKEKLFQYSRQKLRRLRESDPKGLIKKATELREEKKKT